MFSAPCCPQLCVPKAEAVSRRARMTCFCSGRGTLHCSECGFTSGRGPHAELGNLHRWRWQRLCCGLDNTMCLLASNHLSLPPRMATRTATLTCWAQTSGLPTPLTPSGKLVLKCFERWTVPSLSLCPRVCPAGT